MTTIYKNAISKNIFLIAMMLLFGYLSIRLFGPYLNILVLAFIIVQIFHPFYQFVLNRTNNRSLATFLSVLVAIIIVALTLTILGLLTYSELKTIIEGNSLSDLLHKFQDFINSIVGSIDDLFKRFNIDVYVNPLNLTNSNIPDLIKKLFDSFQNQNVNLPQQVISAGAEVVYNTFYIVGDFLFQFFLLLFSLIYLFPNYTNLPRFFDSISPLDKDINDLIFDKFIKTVKGTIKGTFLVAVIQATVMIIPMVMLGVGAPVFLWLLMVIVSVVPIGSGLVWVPAGILIIFNGVSTGNPVQSLLGFLLLLYGAIMVNIIDTPLRSNLIKDTVDIHPLVTIFSILGGLVLFGFFGVIYGPLIVVIFTTIVDVFKKHGARIYIKPLEHEKGA